MSNRRIANSHSNTPSENESNDNIIHTENNFESLQDETSVKPLINPTDNTPQNPLQIPERSFSETITRQRPKLAVELKQHFSAIFSSEQIETEFERLRLQHQQRFEAANQSLRKQEMERKQLIQQLNQLVTEIQHDNILSEKTQLIPSISKKYHHIKLQDLKIPILHHSFFMLLQKVKNKHLLRMLLISLKTSYIFPTKSLPFEKHCIDNYLIPLIREHHDSYLYYINYKTCGSSFVDVPFTVVFNPAKNVNTRIFSKSINSRAICLKIQDVFLYFY